MTTPSTERKAGPLLGTGAQTTWPFTFKVFAATDIAVTIADSLGVETALTYGVDYTVTLNANQETSPGGTVTYPISGSPLPVGSRLVIVGNLPYDQPLDLPAGGNFSPLALENQLDRTVMQIQQLAEKTGRALQVSITTDADVTLPPPAASQLIGWDSTGENLENVPLSELATAIAYGTYRYDTFTGDGTTTNFALSEDPAALANLDVSISGVVQVPGTDYSLVNGNLVFASAPANGTTILARYGQALPSIPDSDQVSFVQAGSGAVTRTVQNKLRDVVDVFDFIPFGTNTAITNCAPYIQAAFNSGARKVTFGQGGVFYCSAEIEVLAGAALQVIEGPATILADHNGPDYPGSTAAIRSAVPVQVNNLTFIADNPDFTTTVIAWNNDDFSYIVRDFCMGFIGVEGTELYNCRFEHFYRAVSIDGSFDDELRTILQNCTTIECGGGSAGVQANMNFYACNDVWIDNHYAYKGAEITLPSNKRVMFTNSVIILPNTPAIDVGGSLASGYETEEVIITNNTSYGRDGIVCEGGAYRVVIANNICILTMSAPNGVGIGVTSQGDTGQAVYEVNISDNVIRAYGEFQNSSGTVEAIGISVRNNNTVLDSRSVASKITISNNSMNTYCFYGVYVQAVNYGATGYANNVNITGNRINESNYGVYCENAQYLDVNSNTIRFGVNAVYFNKCGDFSAENNKTMKQDAGLVHYRTNNPQAGNNRIYIRNSDATQDTEAILIENVASNAALPYLESEVPGAYTNFRVKLGSITKSNPTPGGFIGQVCTTGTTSSTVWKTYGAISV